MSALTLGSTPRFLLAPEIARKISTLNPEFTADPINRIRLELPKDALFCWPSTRAPATPSPFDFTQATPAPSPILVYDASAPTAPLIRDRIRVLIPNTNPLYTVSRDSLHAMDKTDKMCREVLKRNPVNSASKEMKAYLLERDPTFFNNAAWIPSLGATVFGLSDPTIFAPFHSSPDIVAHEFGHAVVDYAGGLTYANQSGALNESIADTIAIMVKHYDLGVPAGDPTANWSIAEGLVVGGLPTGNAPLRSMSHPGTAFDRTLPGGIRMHDSQVGHMDDYVTTTSDSGGVHTNSGIPSKAFYIAATQEAGGSWDTIGKVWIRALGMSSSESTFSKFAANTLLSAHSLYPANGNIVNIVGRSWQQVGVDFGNDLLTTSDKVFPAIGGVLAGLAAGFGAATFVDADNSSSKVQCLSTGLAAGITMNALMKTVIKRRRLESIGFNA